MKAEAMKKSEPRRGKVRTRQSRRGEEAARRSRQKREKKPPRVRKPNWDGWREQKNEKEEKRKKMKEKEDAQKTLEMEHLRETLEKEKAHVEKEKARVEKDKAELDQEMARMSGSEGYERAMVDVSRGFQNASTSVEQVRAWAALGHRRRRYFEGPFDGEADMSEMPW